MNTVLSFKPDQIRGLREGLGLSQQEFADRIGVTKQAVSSWETGASSPSIENLLRMVNACGAKLDSFFEVESAARRSA